MSNILENLYLKKIHLNSGLYAKDLTYVEAAQLKEINYEKLLAMLNEPEKEILEKYLDAYGEMNAIENYNTFTCAFKLGALLMVEIFMDKNQAAD
ncbi:MAG: hypothetical protein FWE20_11815 [Defluviitaleaceae bacterium]|nr:hypothetical protein [Defluviitaleaceae bacterium]